MSFLTDLLEGNFGNLGTDISHAPSSLAAHPQEIAELAGAVALPFLGFAGADALGLGAAGDLGAGADVATTLDAAATEGGAGAVADTLAAATPEELAAAAPELGGAEASLGTLGGVADATDFGGLANAYTAEEALGLPGGGAGGAVVDAAANVGETTTPVTSAELGQDVSAAIDENASDPYAAEATIASSDAAAGPVTPAAAAPAVATNAAATPAAGGGFASQVGGVLNSPITKAAELALPLGFLGYNLLKGPNPIPGQAQQAVNNASASTTNVPLLNQTVQQDLGLANQYQVTPGMQASLDTQKQNAYNQLYQNLAGQGLVNPTQSTQWIQGKAKIDQDIETQKGVMVNNLVTQALQAQQGATSATSAADQTLLAAAQLQVQQDSNFQSAISSALQSFGMLAAFQNLGSNKAAA